jgi:hypothetical protein
MRMRVPAALLLALCCAPALRAEVVLTNGVSTCAIRTPRYQLRVDTASPRLIALQAPDGQPLLEGIVEFSLAASGRRFTWQGKPAPHLHTLRAGPHLVELCIENIVLRADGEMARSLCDRHGGSAGVATWPGLAELHVTCQEQKVYVHVRFLLPVGEWVNAGRFVYRRPEGHPPAGDCSPSRASVVVRTALQARSRAGGLILGRRPCLAAAAMLPEGRPDSLAAARQGLDLTVPVGETPWQPGAVREAAWAFLIAADPEQASLALDAERYPLPPQAFVTTMGQCDGFDPRTGLYVFRAQTSPTPEPPRGLRAGSAFAVTNDARGRTLLIDSFDPWGGICGGIVRDSDGAPLPVRIQFGLNFPELHAEAGEPGWATLTFPLSLAPRERREIRADHLYGGASDHDLLFLTSLENVGDPLLVQATVSRVESFTVNTGLYPGQMKPGNELRINDSRRHYRDLRVRSVSAILPTFFGYYDADDHYQGLVPGEFHIAEAGPFLAEMTIAARTPDGRVEGSVHLWEVPCSDRTRLFAEVELRTREDVPLSQRRPAPLFFLRHHAFNPMAYRRFAAWVAPGRVHVGELNFKPEVVVNGRALGARPFGCLYQASNAIDQGIPCSDIVGNPGWMLVDFAARAGNADIPAGLYAFATGAEDPEHGDYARDLAVVPAQPIRSLPAGTVIRYRALQVVYGDNASDCAPMLDEREAWAVNPLRVEARVGTVMSDAPPHLRAAGGVAEFTISGGMDWMAVKVGGFQRIGHLRLWRIADDGTRVPLHAGDGDPWYISWPDGDGGIGHTFLVSLPEGGGPLRLRVADEP